MTPDLDTKDRCFRALLIWGNLVIACCGIALMAMCIFFISDRGGLYVLVYATGNDSIWRGAWIGVFTGFALFCTSIFGMHAIVVSKRNILLAYILLMVIIYAFEVASAITAATHKDWVTKTSARKQQSKCCGVYGPEDWVKYESHFRQQNTDADNPWPRQCCQQDATGAISHLEACKIGVSPFLHAQGCYDYIAGPLIRHVFGVSWFGFAILCWTFFVILGVIFHYNQLDF
ncbi:uroplakin-1b-like [Salvelinus fontinalis]|uniref:uroplakin-1b-like n=1 Tax=Salvelinus fontinalis TaxID=8038 RepID=UPI0024856308|nr:uroplakin-1b-like [Salvelinus fontinalis]